MAVTILEALQNANVNLKANNTLQLLIAKDQLNNAVTLLEKGYSMAEEVEPLIEKHGSIEDVPDLN